ncbi:MAG: glutaredoxin family protein, partial [Planctomycetaceae bacterium]
TGLREALTVELFVRPGCPHCADAKAWLPGLIERHPALEPVVRDLVTDPAARTRLGDLVRRHRMAAASAPAFHLCNRLGIDFDDADRTGRRLEALLTPWTRPCPDSIGEPLDDVAPPPDDDSTIDLPLVGTFDAHALGMPLFTVAIGLVDGFNPCAMWVLLLLLSILVNVQDRIRILAVAGTFVVVSGLAYLAFMAAWLNVFEWFGYLRPVQVSLGLLAIVVGAIHVKDFFAFHSGVTLSIPEAAKPGIYQRIRRIVTAENLTGAVIGAVVLAVLVNVVELLCTAGLPALYTNILSLQGYSTAVRYGYLGLYILAYMLDDTVMVTGVVATLSRFKLQETGGRWLKLVSGGVILVLGLVMLLRPEWIG